MKNLDSQDSVIVEGIQLSRRHFLAMLAGGVALGALGNPLSALAQAAAANGGVLRVAAQANPSSLDPATGGSGSDHVFLYPIFDTLVEWDYATLQPKPGLAKSWEFKDPRTLVLTLEQGVKFHDGTPFDAEAVKFNLDRSRTDVRSNIRTDLASVESVEVTGPYEVVLHLKAPDAALPLILSDRAGMMVSPKALKEMGERHDRNPVGTGAMKFVSWADGAKIVCTRNPDYWKPERYAVAGIEFTIITDPATRLRSLMSGQSDLAYHLGGRQLPLIERAKGLQVYTDSTIYCFQLYLNYSRGPLQDVRVRQALNYAIDRQAYVQAVLAGAGEPAYMNLPKSHWAYDPEVAKLYPYDPDKAKALLKEAGYGNGVKLDMRGYNDQATIQAEEVLLAQFAKVGIGGRFTNGTIPEMSAAYFARGEGDLILSAWTGRPDPSMAYGLMYSKNAYFNAGRVAPPEGFDEALAESRATDDLAVRKQALAKVQRLVMEHALVVPLAFRMDIVAAASYVQGYRNNLLGKPKFEGVSLKKA